MAGPERDAVMIVANMVEAALARGLADDRRRQDHGGPSGTAGDSVRAPVDHCAGTRAYRVDRSSIRAGAGSCAARVERCANLDNRRRSGSIRPDCVGPVRGQGAGGAGCVCVGEVGASLGLEVSRLARSSADLQRLLELCALTDTLVIDSDGIYDLGSFNDDLGSFNDRLLLGLKGTMSEAELHLLAGRLQGAKLAAAQRGELRFPLPVGYVYDEDGRTVIDLHEEVRAAVSDVFASFEAKGSAYAVVAAFAGRLFPTRAYGGVWAGEIRWGRLTHGRVLQLLANPSYAGAYVFGRFRSRRAVDPDGTIRIKTAELPREQWQVLIRDHHPAHITWETFLTN